MTRARREALRIALVYALTAGLWILLSDRALQWLVADAPAAAWLQTFKGLLFVTLTAAVLFAVLLVRLSREQQITDSCAEAHRRLAAVLETVPHGVEEIALDGTIVYANAARAQMLGYAPGDLIGRKVWDFQGDAEAATALREGFARVVGEEPGRFTYIGSNRRRDGTLVEVQVDWDYRRDEAGALIGFTAVATDVTARRRAERAVHEERTALASQLAQLETLYSTAPVGLLFVDPQLRYVRVNHRLAELNRASVQEHIGHRVQDVSPAAAQVLPLYRHVLATGEPVLNREVAPPTPGERDPRCWQVSYFPVKDAAGHVLGVNGVVLDISTYKRQERRLRESEQRYRVLFRDSPLFLCEQDWSAVKAGLVRLRAQGVQPLKDYLTAHPDEVDRLFARVRIIDSNRAATQLLVPRGGEHRFGREQLFAGEARPGAVRLLLRLAEGEAWYVDETVVMDARGELRAVMLYLQAVPGFEASLERVLVSFVDMTERKRAEQELAANALELRRGALRLERVNRELEQFSHAVAHDLKGPLRAVSNLTSWIEADLGGNLSEECRRMLRLLRGRVRRMDALIDGLLEYAQAGAREGPREEVEVAALLQDLTTQLEVPAAFHVAIGPGMPSLTASRRQLRQVFGSLLSNALDHHTGSEGHVWISVRDRGPEWEFSVTDDGPGIHPAYHQRIFDVFQTLQRRDERERVGIGLPLARKLVQLNGGCLDVESEPGRGATFRFTWPKEPGPVH